MVVSKQAGCAALFVDVALARNALIFVLQAMASKNSILGCVENGLATWQRVFCLCSQVENRKPKTENRRGQLRENPLRRLAGRPWPAVACHGQVLASHARPWPTGQRQFLVFGFPARRGETL